MPAANVSLIDFTFIASRDSFVDGVNQLRKTAAAMQMSGVLEYN